MRVENYISVIDSYRQLGVSNGKAAGKSEKPGSIHFDENKSFGAANVAMSARMQAGNRGLTDISRKAQENITNLQTVDYELQKAGDVLQRMQGLATLSAASAAFDADRVTLDYEFTRYKFELCELGSPRFYSVDLDKAAETSTMSALIDSVATAAPEAVVGSMNVDALGSIRTADAAAQAVSAIDDASKGISDSRAKLSEAQVKLRDEIRGVRSSSDKRPGSERAIRDTETARKTAESIRSRMLSDSAAAAQAQGNVVPQQMFQALM